MANETGMVTKSAEGISGPMLAPNAVKPQSNAPVAAGQAAKAVVDQTTRIVDQAAKAVDQTTKTAVDQTTAVARTALSDEPETGTATALTANPVPAAAQLGAKRVKSAMESAMTTTEEFVSFSQGNLDAFVKSSQIWVAGVQDIGKHVAESAQTHFDRTVSAWQSLASAKSVKEAVELQSSLARTALERAVSDTGRITDASLKLAEQTMAPIAARASAVSERFGRAA